MVAVSIVVPIYNVEKYLNECLKSIQKQTLKDIEVICVDDGSKDNSLKIAEKYARSDERFKIITKNNAGYGDSMNRGFDASTGEYIGIVESDDYIEYNMFESLYNAAKFNKCEIVKSDYYEFTTKKKKRPTYIKTVTDDAYYNTVINYKTTLELFHFRMNTWTGIYLRDFIIKNNIRHNLTPGASYQDNGFWFQTLSLAERIMFLNKSFYHYRQDNPNSSINNKAKVFCMCDEYEYIEDFLNKHKEISEDLTEIFLLKKYFNYMYTYERVGDEYKIQFLKRFAEDFREASEKEQITTNLVDSNIVQIINRIVIDPEMFYYEDMIWRIQHQTIDDILKIRNINNNIFYKICKFLRVY